MKILKLTKKDHKATFLFSVGDFLTMKEVHTEIGEPVYDTPDMVWFVAFDDDGKALGFTSYINQGETVKLAWAWVLPDHREKGIYKLLWDARWKEIESLKPQKVKATCRIILKDWFLKRGFTITKEWKNYFNAERIWNKSEK